MAPKLIGGATAATAIAGEGIAEISEALQLETPEVQPVDGDLYTSSAPARLAADRTSARPQRTRRLNRLRELSGGSDVMLKHNHSWSCRVYTSTRKSCPRRAWAWHPGPAR